MHLLWALKAPALADNSRLPWLQYHELPRLSLRLQLHSILVHKLLNLVVSVQIFFSFTMFGLQKDSFLLIMTILTTIYTHATRKYNTVHRCTRKGEPGQSNSGSPVRTAAAGCLEAGSRLTPQRGASPMRCCECWKWPGQRAEQCSPYPHAHRRPWARNPR